VVIRLERYRLEFQDVRRVTCCRKEPARHRVAKLSPIARACFHAHCKNVELVESVWPRPRALVVGTGSELLRLSNQQVCGEATIRFFGGHRTSRKSSLRFDLYPDTVASTSEKEIEGMVAWRRLVDPLRVARQHSHFKIALRDQTPHT